jgi:cytochrome c oxidase subunit 3
VSTANLDQSLAVYTAAAGEHEEEDHRMFGFIVFLLSESVIFISFFVGYIVFKTTAADWYPAGFEGLEIREPFINTVVLVSSSFVIYFAERFLHKENLWGFIVPIVLSNIFSA